jgi:glycerol kinase
MEPVILSIDQSTSATKGILFAGDGRLICRRDRKHRQYCPRSGWVEHDALEVWENTRLVCHDVLEAAGVAEEQLSAISLANQRETVVVWNRRTGIPICNAIVWQDNRSEGICRELALTGCSETVKRKTGLRLSPYFSAAKIKWILDWVPGARELADEGELLAGTMDSWLIWNLTGRTVHATDYSNACRTQLFNIGELRWDSGLLSLFCIPNVMMADVRASDSIYGCTMPDAGFSRQIPITGVMGDSHAALFGQCCFEKGMAKATYGTGSSVMMHVGDKPVTAAGGLVTSIAWGMRDTVEYVLEGNINSTGDTIRWLAEDLELIGSAVEAGALASSIPDTGGVYMVPAFTGLGAPWWDGGAKASITGMTRGTKKAHLVRAAEESTAYQIRDVLDLMKSESGTELRELRVDGGPTRDGFLMQFQADILDCPLACSGIEELSAFGSFLMAEIAIGWRHSLEELVRMKKTGTVYVPVMDEANRSRLYLGWREAVTRTLSERKP